MRIPFLLLIVGAGCIAGRTYSEGEDRLLREISRQQRWAQQALEAKPNPDLLERIRNSDYEAVGAARKELRRLIAAVERGTWVREAAAAALEQDHDPQLMQEFDRAGRVRRDALLAADELAEALAEAHGGLTIGDLRPGFEALRKARQSEDALAKQAAAAKPGAPRLAPAPLPVPEPFIEAAAKLVHAHAELAKELDRLPPEDAARIRARLGDLERQKEEQKREAAPATAAAAAPPPAPAEAEAPAPSDTLNIANDAADLIKKKGPPRSITLRPDGLFGLKYDEANYLVDPEGKLVRTEKP